MLQSTQLATYLNEKMTELTTQFTFKFFAEVGHDKGQADIVGILKSETQTLPVNGSRNAMYKYRVDMQVPSGVSNDYFMGVKKAVEELVTYLNGRTVTFDNVNCYITANLPHTGTFDTRYGQGNTLPLSFDLSVNYGDGVISSNSKKWFINGVLIKYLSESLSVSRNGNINPINDRKFTQALMTSQTRYYTFNFLFEDNEMCKQLQSDLLNGELTKKYTLTYYDGVSFTEETPFTTMVVMYGQPTVGSALPNTATFNITFVDADDGQNTTKYYMALIDNPFDAQTDNVRYFATIEEQRQWFADKILLGADFDEIQAPNLNTLYSSNQVYLNSLNYDVFDLVSKNYAIIKVERNNEVYKYFYFNASGRIGADKQVLFDLKMDTVQTYMFDLDIQGSFIEKAHLDRWVYNDDGTVSFNGDKDSPLFEREEIKQVAKRISQRQKLMLATTIEENKPIVDWLNENVYCWVYILLKPASTNETPFKVFDLQDTISKQNANAIDVSLVKMEYQKSDSQFITLAYPIYKGDYTKQDAIQLYLQVGDSLLKTNQDALNDFLKNNDGYSRVYGIKLSYKPPFDINNAIDYNITDNDLVLDVYASFRNDPDQRNYIIGTNNETAVIQTSAYFSDISTGKMLFYILKDNAKNYLDMPSNLYQRTFTREEIINSLKDKKFNPKLNSADYKDLSIKFSGNAFDFDLQKLNDERPNFKFIEDITADTTRTLVTYNTQDENNVYGKHFSDTFSGLVSNNDFTLSISSNQYDNYIANNKNAYASFQASQNYQKEMMKINTVAGVTNSMIDIVPKAVSGAAKMMTTSGTMGGEDVVSAATSTLKMGVNLAQNIASFEVGQAYRQTQFDMSIDNMKNAPETLTNANGSAIFNMSVTDFGIYAELSEGLSAELEIANDIMYRDGYTYNRFGNIKNFINTRAYFNYIKAILGNINGVISTEARADLRDRFSKGIRFWHQDEIDYTKENYEIKLKENYGK